MRVSITISQAIMTPERFQQISQIYRTALEHEPEQRVAFLDQCCGRDRKLRHEVESLLSGGKNVESLLLSKAMRTAAKRLTDEPRSLVGKTLDHYQVLGPQYSPDSRRIAFTSGQTETTRSGYATLMV